MSDAPVVVGEGSDLEKCRPQGAPAGCSELIDDDSALSPLQGVNPVEPHHPGVDKGLGDDKAPHEHDGEQGEGAHSIGYHEVPG